MDSILVDKKVKICTGLLRVFRLMVDRIAGCLKNRDDL